VFTWVTYLIALSVSKLHVVCWEASSLVTPDPRVSYYSGWALCAFCRYMRAQRQDLHHHAWMVEDGGLWICLYTVVVGLCGVGLHLGCRHC
jgi:hypothetical protein